MPAHFLQQPGRRRHDPRRRAQHAGAIELFSKKSRLCFRTLDVCLQCLNFFRPCSRQKQPELCLCFFCFLFCDGDIFTDLGQIFRQKHLPLRARFLEFSPANGHLFGCLIKLQHRAEPLLHQGFLHFQTLLAILEPFFGLLDGRFGEAQPFVARTLRLQIEIQGLLLLGLTGFDLFSCQLDFFGSGPYDEHSEPRLFGGEIGLYLL